MTNATPTRQVRLARLVVRHGYYFGWFASGIALTVRDTLGLWAMLLFAFVSGVGWALAKGAAAQA